MPLATRIDNTGNNYLHSTEGFKVETAATMAKNTLNLARGEARAGRGAGPRTTGEPEPRSRARASSRDASR